MPQVAALHHHALKPEADAGYCAGAGDIGDDLNAHCAEPSRKLIEGRLVLHGHVHHLLQALLGRRLACAQRVLDLALGRSAAHGLPAWLHHCEPQLRFQATHHGLLALIVPAVRNDFAGHADAIGQDVDMLVLGVRVTAHDILAVVVPHALQIGVGGLAPLLVSERLPRRQADAHVAYRLGQIGP